MIRFSWVHDALPDPLWEAGSVLPENATWLRQALGVSDALIRELTEWAEARDALEATGFADAQAVSALDAQADNLVTRLRAEVQPRFTVEHLR